MPPLSYREHTQLDRTDSDPRDFMVDFDDAGSIGKRYRRQDEIGTPYCVTFDFDSLEDRVSN